jgi:hypothetical protein
VKASRPHASATRSNVHRPLPRRAPGLRRRSPWAMLDAGIIQLFEIEVQIVDHLPQAGQRQERCEQQSRKSNDQRDSAHTGSGPDSKTTPATATAPPIVVMRTRSVSSTFARRGARMWLTPVKSAQPPKTKSGFGQKCWAKTGETHRPRGLRQPEHSETFAPRP